MSLMDIETIDNAVIGSGPAGVAAARALLELGLPVTILDAGRELPVAAAKLQAQLAGSEPEAWDEGTLEALRNAGPEDHGDVPLKRLFGSEHSYHFDSRVNADDASILGSFARGGLSNVWGAAIMPFSDSDTCNWPISVAELAPHYEAVLDWMPHAQREDDLTQRFPLYSTRRQPLRLSRQAQALRDDLSNARSRLSDAGISFGQARLAIDGCRYCGMCMHGCPWDAIYKASDTLDDMIKNRSLYYQGGTVVESIVERDDHIELGVNANGNRRMIRAERVYLGTGVLNTAMLLYPLLGRPEFRIRDTAYLIIPFVRFRNTADVQQEHLQTLAQLFTEVTNPSISSRNIHLQWYSYNDLYTTELRRMTGLAYPGLRPFLNRWLLGRLWTAQAFFHSEDSHVISLKSVNDGRAFRLSRINNPRTSIVTKGLLGMLWRYRRDFGGIALGFARREGLPGRGFHAGASLPMAAQPGPLESDVYGRPAGLHRVHVIDASVLPTLPAATVTLTVMANAHRIASQFHEYGNGNA